MDESERPLRIALVGPCASGKSAVGKALRAVGFNVRQPAQEHSYVADMWRRLTRPDLLIYLDVDYDTVQARRPRMGGGPQRLQEQRLRLVHARNHCDLYLDTSRLSLDEVVAKVLDFLQSLPTE